jgi:hypothetical protein
MEFELLSGVFTSLLPDKLDIYSVSVTLDKIVVDEIEWTLYETYAYYCYMYIIEPDCYSRTVFNGVNSYGCDISVIEEFRNNVNEVLFHEDIKLLTEKSKDIITSFVNEAEVRIKLYREISNHSLKIDFL